MKLLMTVLLAFGLVGLSGLPTLADDRPVPVKKRRKVRTGIRWKILPKSVVTYLDGKKIGQVGKVNVTYTRPGRHTVRLVNGEDEAEFDVKVNKGQILEVNYQFTDG